MFWLLTWPKAVLWFAGVLCNEKLFFCQFELVFHTASFTSCSCMSSGMNEIFKWILIKYAALAQCGSAPNC